MFCRKLFGLVISKRELISLTQRWWENQLDLRRWHGLFSSNIRFIANLSIPGVSCVSPKGLNKFAFVSIFFQFGSSSTLWWSGIAFDKLYFCKIVWTQVIPPARLNPQLSFLDLRLFGVLANARQRSQTHCVYPGKEIPKIYYMKLKIPFGFLVILV